MNLKITKCSVLAAFFSLAFWVPVMLFCTHLLLSIRKSTAFFESIHMPFIYVFIILLVLCWFVRKITIYLDGHEPVKNNFVKRLVKQFLYGFIIPLSVVFVLVILYDNFIDEDAIQSAFLIKEVSLVAFFLYFFNGVFVSIGIERKVSIAKNDQARNRSFNDKFLVYHRGYYVPINLNEVAMIYQSGQLNWVVTFNDEKYILNLSLNEANDVLNSKQFFKINRSQIIHKEIIHTLRAGSFGKIELTLKVQTIITTVSKGRAKHFRKWFYSKSDSLDTAISV